MRVPRINRILLIDDDEDDRVVFTHALNEIDASIELNCKSDGVNLMHALSSSKTDIIFLDINLPRKNGLECLKELQGHREFQKIPIIIYTGSDYPKDVTLSYGLGAVLYLKKPSSFVKLVNDLTTILQLGWVK